MSKIALKKMDASALAAQAKQMGAALDSGMNDMPGGSGDVHYVQFSGKSGALTYGQQKEPLDGVELVLEPTATKRGWVYWAGSSVAKKVEWNVIGGTPVAEHELPTDVPAATRQQDGWQAQLILCFVDQDGMGYEMPLGSEGGRRAGKALLDEVIERMAAEEPFYPLLTVGVEQFTASGYTNYKPRFGVSEWLDPADVEAWMDAEAEQDALPEPEPEPKPTRRRRRAVA